MESSLQTGMISTEYVYLILAVLDCVSGESLLRELCAAPSTKMSVLG